MEARLRPGFLLLRSDPLPKTAGASRWPCLSAHADGALLLVAAIPNPGRTEVAGLHDGCLRLRLAAPAIEGRANAALLAWLAASLNLPKRAVQLLAGGSSRRKRVLLHCAESQVADWLAGQCPAPD